MFVQTMILLTFGFLIQTSFFWRRLSEKYQKIIFWLKYHYHGLEWNSEKFLYTEIRNILQKNLNDATKFFVHSDIKKEWLKRFGFYVENIIDYGYLSFKKPRQATICLNHDVTCKIVIVFFIMLSF